MCGIAGFFNSPLKNNSFPGVIIEMLRRINYRGPDEIGYFFDKKSSVGSVRLSIIDLENGQQPFFDKSGRYCLVYNGELYNYLELKSELEQLGRRFETKSDTEVILQSLLEWGEAALLKFNGGYAFTFYDRFVGDAIIARDRFGKRPLFYININGALLFASELKCFIGYPDMQFEWDVEALESVLSIWTPLPEQTVFKGVKQIPPGGLLRYKSGIVEIKEYYEIPLAVEQFAGNESDARSQVRDLLEKSVRLRMRSDVNVGTYLSGGLDSAIITRLAADQSDKPIHSFSVAFEDNEFDESRHQREASIYLGTKHESILIRSNDIAEHFPNSIWHAETPLFRTALVPLLMLSKHVNQAGIKVALTGEGADEIFLGYDIFKESQLRLRWKTLSLKEKENFVALLYPYLKHFSSDNAKSLVAVYDKFSNESDSALFSHEMRFQNSKFSLRLLRGGNKDGLNAMRSYVGNQKNITSLTLIQRTQWIEFKTLLAGYLLSSQGDRMSLANSVENRCPFLDKNLVEFANSLPVSMRLKNDINEKSILKDAYRDFLPKSIVERFKQPYRAPDASAFIGPNRPEYIDMLLDEKRLSKIEFLDVNFCRRLYLKLMSTENLQMISPKENQAFIFLLSIVLLDSQIVRNENEHLTRIMPLKFSKCIDGREYGELKNDVYQRYAPH